MKEIIKALRYLIKYGVFFIYVIVGILCVWYIKCFISEAKTTAISQLDMVYFTLVTTSLTLIASIGITHFIARKKATDDIKLLGQSAIRHIKQIITTMRILGETVEQKYEKLDKFEKDKKQADIELVKEYLDNIRNQINSLCAAINTAKNDWSNILSEEIKESLEDDEEIWGYVKRITTLREEIEKRDKIVKQQKDERQKESDDYKKLIIEQKDKIKLLKQTEEELRSKVIERESKPLSWPTYFNTSGNQIFFSGITMCGICHVNTALNACAKCGTPICAICQSYSVTTYPHEIRCINCSLL